MMMAVWPDVEIKSSPIFPIVDQKQATEVLNRKVLFFKIAQKVTDIFGQLLMFKKQPNLVTIMMT